MTVQCDTCAKAPPGARQKNTGLEQHLFAGNVVILMDVLYMVFGYINMKTLGEMLRNVMKTKNLKLS